MRTPRLPAARGRLLALVAACCVAAPAAAQHSGGERNVPDVPAGDGAISVRVVHTGGGDVADLALALYSLSPDGAPGLRDGRSDTDGGHRFEDISAATGITYLVGVRYRDVPFGERVAFAPEQRELRVTLEVSEPVLESDALTLRESELRADWIGDRLAVQERHVLVNESPRVVLVPAEARETAPPTFATRLPEGAHGFAAAPGAFGSGLEEQGGAVRFFGPVYPGEQEIRFGYLIGLSGSGDAEEVTLRGRLPDGAHSMRFLSAESGPGLSVEGGAPAESVERDGRPYRSAILSVDRAGAAYAARFAVPASTGDRDLLAIGRVDLWTEVDDTAIQVSQEVMLEVAGDRRLLGTPEAPLLNFAVPREAQLQGTSANAAELGLGVGPAGGLDLVGPLPPGESRFVLRYRLPVTADDEPARAAWRFPAEVGVVNLLTADTGLVVEDARLHRLRPIRSGTRVYLRREGFRIGPEETIDVSFRRVERGAVPRWASLTLVLVLASGGLAFALRPLRPVAPEGGAESDAHPLARERSLIYSDIHDLDHDYETGKLDEADYNEMRSELRRRAVELLRRERRGEPPASDASTPEPKSASEADGAGFCPDCGQRVKDGWRFCAGCGRDLDAARADLRGGGTGA